LLKIAVEREQSRLFTPLALGTLLVSLPAVQVA
jgi:hypothetical protein